MRTQGKVCVTVCIVIAIFMLDAGSAAANRIGITNAEKGFRMAWEAFHVELTGLGGGNVVCPLTLKGRFSVGTFAKTEGTRVGVVDRAISGVCERGSMTVLTETLPWTVSFASFTGILPNITSITLKLIRAAFRFSESGLTCLVTTSAAHPLELRGALSREGAMTSTEASYSASGLLCEPITGAMMSGSARLTVLAETSAPRFILTEGSISPPVEPSLSGNGEFGRLEVEGVAKRVITINAGTEAITVESIRARAGNYFGITDPNRCIGSRLAVNGRCSFDAVFTAPAEAGRSVEDQISVEAGLSPALLTVRGST
jgi:hypothetical protein